MNLGRAITEKTKIYECFKNAIVFCVIRYALNQVFYKFITFLQDVCQEQSLYLYNGLNAFRRSLDHRFLQ